MRRIVGIDEAGYGPNLGPFVMTSVGCRLDEEAGEIDLWEKLSEVAGRRADAKDGRVMIDDSKLVHAAGSGLSGLESGVLTALQWEGGDLDALLEQISPPSHPEITKECWYRGDTQLPTTIDPEDLGRSQLGFQQCSKVKGIEWIEVRSMVICPPHFNALIQRYGSKGGPMAYALCELLIHQQAICPPNESLKVHVDKHGGRNAYAPMLQEAFADRFVRAERESAALSCYCVDRGESTIRISFLPRADQAHFCVALASMVSKYVRELLMLEFNRFWQEQIPGLMPTAGYPADAGRFMEQIRPAIRKLNLDELAIWRER